jgi:transcriptional regulator with XRE-family HTH domain
MKIKLGNTARRLRESQGLTQRQMAESLGVSVVHISNIETNKADPSRDLLDRYAQLWGIDLYVLAWCLHGDIQKLPPAIRKTASELGRLWQKQLDIKESNAWTQGTGCTSDK